MGQEADFLDRLTAWENAIEEWEHSSGEFLQETIKAAVIAERAPTTLANYIRLNGAKLDNYAKIKDMAVEYITATVGSQPMDIGAVWGGKHGGSAQSGGEQGPA